MIFLTESFFFEMQLLLIQDQFKPNIKGRSFFFYFGIQNNRKVFINEIIIREKLFIKLAHFCTCLPGGIKINMA